MPGYRKYVKKVPRVKKLYKRTRKAVPKSTKSLVRLIKNVSLRQAETKNTHNIYEDGQLYHNVPNVLARSLYTTQSTADNDDGISNFACRIGDQVVARGLSIKIWLANKLDRPNVMYKIVVFKYQSTLSATIGSPAPFYAQGTANYMIRDLNTESYKILKVRNVNLQTNAQKITGSTFTGAESHKAVHIWIPMKNQKLTYENAATSPKFWDIGVTIVCYDSYGTLITDNIASYAINRKFYFKDP